MMKPTLPGFSAEMSLYRTSGYDMVRSFNTLEASTAMIGAVHPAQDPVFLRRRTFGGGNVPGGTFGLSWCELGCDITYGLCTAGCAGVTGGLGIALCITGCTAVYQGCKASCQG